jgi:hypothetical protein
MAIITNFYEQVEALCENNKYFFGGWPAAGKSTASHKLSKIRNIELFCIDHLRGEMADAGLPILDAEPKLKKLVINKPYWIVDAGGRFAHRSFAPIADVTLWFDSNRERMIKYHTLREEDYKNRGIEMVGRPGDKFGLDLLLSIVDGIKSAREDIMNNYSEQKPIIEIKSFEQIDKLLDCAIEKIYTKP